MDLLLLYKLQGLQKEADIIDRKLKELDGTRDLKKLREEYQRLKEEYAKNEEKLKNNAYRQEVRNNEIRNLEFNKEACEKIKFSRDTDTVKKLETIDKQLEKVEEKRKEAENDIIALVDEAHNINMELADIKKRMAFIKKKYLSSKESVEKAVKELEEQKSELDLQIEAIIKEIDKESYEIYSRLLKVHTDPVATVEKRKCGGCKMEVPAMDYEALKSGSDHMRCQSCGRLLYYIKP